MIKRHNSQTYVSTIGSRVASSAGTVPGSALVSTGPTVQTGSTVTWSKPRGRRHCRKHRLVIYNSTSCSGGSKISPGFGEKGYYLAESLPKTA